MGRKNWSSKSKLEVVIAGLKGKMTIAEICNNYGVSQVQFYGWKDEFLKNGSGIFERGGLDGEVERLKRKNIRLKTIIGDLTTELKKNDYED